MKCSLAWLREWVNPGVTTQQLADQLTMAGLEVDSITPVAGAFSGVVVGCVRQVAEHPDARKLHVCQVDTGDAQLLQIVCGAANVRPNLRVAVAKIGAQLPGLTIKAAKLRGVDSAGMLCSASELGLADSSSGLLELPDEAPLGADLRGYLDLDDDSIEIDLTPNRGDCLSVAGIAREIGVLNRCSVQGPSTAAVAAANQHSLPVALQAPIACPHYVGRVISGINPQAHTPLWMQERLRRSGLRSLGAVVDVTNYVMLELGQPMHAFDLAKLQGGIQVRLAVAGESLTLLDGQTVTLDANTLVIADHQRPLALAGVMGGEPSSVTAQTQAVFLESAFFTPHLLAGCARRYGLQTDSAQRFERGVDPALQVRAIERATALLLSISGGQPGPVIEVTAPEYLPDIATIHLRAHRIERLLGLHIPAATITDMLSRLGVQLEHQQVDDHNHWQVVPPSFRFDMRHEADLIEEIARVYGYNKLPSAVAPSRIPLPSLPNHGGLPALQAILVQRGYQEAITYSFVDAEMQHLIDPAIVPLPLANPLSADLAVMRTSLWVGLLSALRHNLNRQQPDVRLFESGLRFMPGNQDQLRQEPMLAGVITGRHSPEQWGATARPLDFFDLKGDLEALLQHLGQPRVTFAPSSHPALHPGQTAAVLYQNQPIGVLGCLHPQLAKQLDLPAAVYLFEIALTALLQSHLPVFCPLSKYPSVRRDLALVVDAPIAVSAILESVRNQAGELLTNLQLFDIYQGKGIDSGKKSLAIGLTFQASSRNLTDTEIEAVVAEVLKGLNDAFGATLRS